MATGSWQHHLGRALLAAAAVLAVAWLSGEPVTVIAIALAALLLWHAVNAWRLNAWLNSGAREPPRSLGLWSDLFNHITELKNRNRLQAEQLQELSREFEGMTDAFPDAVIVIDDDDRLTGINDAARLLLGLRIPDDLGRPVTNLLRGSDFANWLAVQDRVESRLEIPCPGDSTVHLCISAMKYRQGQRLLILRDTTEIHNLERVRRDFVANVSHELRTPLTVLLGYLESMQESCEEELQPVVLRMQDQARQMQALLGDLLELARLQGGEQEDAQAAVDIPAMLMLLKEQAEELSQGHHALRFEIQPGLRLRGTAADLESAFRNLISNAVHYTPDGGRVTVRWQDRADGPALSVADTGIGIPKRDIGRLTERFYRVGADRSRNSGGTGLGLAIVKHVLNAHQARLTIESELGAGSRFICRFPVERRVMAPEPEAANP